MGTQLPVARCSLCPGLLGTSPPLRPGPGCFTLQGQWPLPPGLCISPWLPRVRLTVLGVPMEAWSLLASLSGSSAHSALFCSCLLHLFQLLAGLRKRPVCYSWFRPLRKHLALSPVCGLLLSLAEQGVNYRMNLRACGRQRLCLAAMLGPGHSPGLPCFIEWPFSGPRPS